MKLDNWIQHFARNGQNRPEPNWNAPLHPYPAKTEKALLQSLTQFQLGDGGGPAYLIGWNLEPYFDQNPAMRELVDLWFIEEERHSALLEKAVYRLGGTPIDSHWSFSIFCAVRKIAGVRFELYALLLTEITSNNYYKLLRKYAGDPAIVSMCELIVRDETGHIAFHRDRLAFEMDGRYRLGWLWSIKMYLLALGAGTMLWINHRKPLVWLGATTLEFYSGFLNETGRFIKTARLRRNGKFSPQQLLPKHKKTVQISSQAGAKG